MDPQPESKKPNEGFSFHLGVPLAAFCPDLEFDFLNFLSP